MVFLASCILGLRVLLGCITPLDEGKDGIPFPGCDLDAGDAAGMDTGTGVVIGLVGMKLLSDAPIRSHLGLDVHPLREREVFIDGAVGVSGDDRIHCAAVQSGFSGDARSGPGVQGFVNFVAESGIVGRPCGIPESAALESGPEIPNEELAESRADAAAGRICLVAVPHKDVPVKDCGLVDGDSRKQFAKGCLVLLPVEVVVAPDLDVAGAAGIGVVE